jgi:hypothetical protein
MIEAKLATAVACVRERHSAASQNSATTDLVPSHAESEKKKLNVGSG